MERDLESSLISATRRQPCTGTATSVDHHSLHRHDDQSIPAFDCRTFSLLMIQLVGVVQRACNRAFDSSKMTAGTC